MFDLQSSFKPAGDQPKAIKEIQESFAKGENKITLLGATGTGKTFTMANIIQHVQKPTLIISHNKTLAAQLATEFKYFFPNNAVHYFVSYFDYYQPESYLPAQGLYIEKEATINQEIEMYRLGAMASLLSRPDVIVVASVSSLYGLGQKRFFQENCLQLEVGKEYKFELLKRQLLRMQYKPIQSKIEHGMFEIKGDIVDIFSSTEKYVYRLHFNEEVLELIELKDATSFEYKGKLNKITVRPATQFLQDITDLDVILEQMDAEKEMRVKEFMEKKMFIEAERIKKRVEYDIRMIKETGFVNGIENYSVYFDHRLPGEAPSTIFEYFPDDFLMIIDESHMTIPQLKAMPSGDKARKDNLIKYGFRLPSASDHRPLNFEELQYILNRNQQGEHISSKVKSLKSKVKWVDDLTALWPYDLMTLLKWRTKHNSKTIFLSATPAQYELEISDKIVEQLIRPTGLLDPITYVYPKSGDYLLLEKSITNLLTKKPHLDEFMHKYTINNGVKEIFEGDEENTI